jgi:hypothetical protein
MNQEYLSVKKNRVEMFVQQCAVTLPEDENFYHHNEQLVTALFAACLRLVYKHINLPKR